MIESPLRITPGSRLGPYAVVAPIGAGGMGEVYRARDTKLNRDVAIKVLPAAFSINPDRIARFNREAQLLAALNHPNIAAIYGLEESSGVRALVLELVEGPTLANRIAQGAMPVDEALHVAQQIAEALEAAHEQGVIHRDLKPANVKLRPDGVVKVLDFGLAKALDSSTGAAFADAPRTPTPEGADQDVDDLPTEAGHATHVGAILGTAAYMAPEQAMGKPVDRRADIWGFGILLFEMLSGRKAYSGDTRAATLAQVIERDVDWHMLPAALPPTIVALLGRCLTKDSRKRLQAIGEARLAIEQALTEAASRSSSPKENTPVAPRVRRPVSRQLAWFLTAAVVLGALAFALGRPWRASIAMPSAYVSTELNVDTGAVLGLGASAVLAPNGAVLAFVGSKAGVRIYVRRLDDLQAVPVRGTERGRIPFFSPDGQSIGFFADGKLKKVSLDGGPVVTLADAPQPRGGAWAEDGTITFAPGRGAGLVRISSSGGNQQPLTTLVEGEAAVGWPQMLPGDAGVLYTSYGRPSTEDNAALVVQPLPSGPRKIVHRGGYFGRYAPSGHLLFVRDFTLFAAPFNVTHLETTGFPTPVVERVQSILPGGAEYAFSQNGTLVFFPSAIGTQGLPMSWMDRDGKLSALRPAIANWSNAAFAPDGHRLAVDISGDGQQDVWIIEWERNALARLTVDGASNTKPVWTPNGGGVAFGSRRGGVPTSNLYWQRADGTGDVTRLTDTKTDQYPTSWHPSGRFLAFDEAPASQLAGRAWFSDQSQGDSNVMILPMEGDDASGWKPGKPIAFVNTRFNESEGMFSPDGRWMAYTSNETGRNEIYVRAFPGPGGRWLISNGGGTWPTWSRKSNELYFLNGDVRVMVATFAVAGDTFRPDAPRLWSGTRVAPRGPGRWFNLHPDDERFVVAVGVPGREDSARSDARSKNYVFVFNFFDELRRRVLATR
jgi:serine/threonine protein kinase